MKSSDINKLVFYVQIGTANKNVRLSQCKYDNLILLTYKRFPFIINSLVVTSR